MVYDMDDSIKDEITYKLFEILLQKNMFDLAAEIANEM